MASVIDLPLLRNLYFNLGTTCLQYLLSLDELVMTPDSLCNERAIRLGRSLSPEEGQAETQEKL